MVLLDESASSNSSSSASKASSIIEKLKQGQQQANVKRAYKAKLKLADVAIFAQQLSSMLNAGLSLSHALEAIGNEMDNRVFKIIILKIRESIFAGASFSESVKAFPRAFPPLFLSMIEAGEVSGSLPEAMKTVSTYFDASVKLTKKLKSALTYPVAVITMSIGLVSALLVFVIPVFAEMFSGFGAKLPLPTQILIDLSEFLKAYILYVLIGVGGFGYLAFKFSKTSKGSAMMDATLRFVPIFGNLIQKTNIARFCRTYSVLLASGVPIIKTIEICTNVANSFYLRLACSKIKAGIQEGKQLSVLLEEVSYFPRIVVTMAKAGEQAGNVEEMIKNVADLYETDVNNMVAAMTSLIEPLLVCFLGIVIGGIVIAMFMPIFQLSSVVSQ